MRQREREALLEYQYHQAITGTPHDVYENLPNGHIQWMIRIHNLYQTIEAEQAKKASQ